MPTDESGLLTTETIRSILVRTLLEARNRSSSSIGAVRRCRRWEVCDSRFQSMSKSDEQHHQLEIVSKLLEPSYDLLNGR